MRSSALSLVIGLVGLLGTGSVLLGSARLAPAATKTPMPKALVATAPRRAEPSAAAATPSPFSALPLVRVENQTSRDVTELRLYDAIGRVDEGAAARLDEVLSDARDPRFPETGRIERRTLQLMFKAAYHFRSYDIEVVSGYRKPGRRREGPHGTGAAVDFRLRNVKASELATYLRSQPRTGVGIYTHPKTQYVHLDVREHSFHWLDASPPRRHWREKSIGSRDLPARDARYSPALDLPEGLPASPLPAP